MKIIKKLLKIRIVFLYFVFFSFFACKKEVEKKDFVGFGSTFKKEKITELKSHKWKLRKIYVYNSLHSIIHLGEDNIRFEDIEDKIVEFREKDVRINSKIVGNPTKSPIIFIINDLDTLTNKYFLYRLKNDRLVLKNDVGYYKDKKLFKRFTIELFLTKDTIKSNKEYYKVQD